MDTVQKVPLRFFVVRIAWVVTALVIAALFVLGAAYTYRALVGQPGAPVFGAPDPGASLADLVGIFTAWGLSLQTAAWLSIAFEAASGLTSVVLGVLLFLRLLSPRRIYDRMAMFTSFMLLTYGLLITNVMDVIDEGLEPWYTVYVLVGFLATVLFFLFLLIFPDGRYHPRWTVLIPWSVLAWMISWFFFPALNPDSWPPIYLNLSVVALIVLAGSVQVYRYLKVYTPVQRQQTKWVALVLVVMISLGSVQSLVNDNASFISRTDGLWGMGYLLEQVVFNLTEVIFPVTLFLVILRYRLWEVDRLINKVLVYSVVTVLLVGIYSAIVVVLQGIFRSVAGQDSPLAVAASTLFIAALFNPARARVQAFVDRRFYRKHYDAGQALSEFGALIWQETDLETLTGRLLDVVQNTLQPDDVTLWLAPVQSSPGVLGSSPYSGEER